MRYAQPYQSERPAYSHRFDAFSPKLGRSLILFSYCQLRQWLLLEALPGVKAFCERPDVLVVKNRKPVLIDFWIQQENTELFLIFRENNQPGWEWLKPPLLRIHYIKPSQLDKWDVLVQNWQSMLPYLVSYRHWLTPQTTLELVNRCTPSVTLGELENTLFDQDVSWIRACVFDAIAKGWLRAPSLKTRPWNQFLTLSPRRAYAH